jgi:hypothetical protein
MVATRGGERVSSTDGMEQYHLLAGLAATGVELLGLALEVRRSR